MPLSTEALKSSLLRLRNEWETVQTSRCRDAIFQYLTAVFDIVMAWAKEGKAVKRAHRALHLRGHNFGQGAGTVCRCDLLHVRSRQGG